MSFAATTGRMALRATRQQLHKAPQRRSMAGGGGPAPEWEGVDKVVRGVFPGDHQRTSPRVTRICVFYL